MTAEFFPVPRPAASLYALEIVNSYSVIFGRYINGGFFSIPNWGVGGELGQFSDTFWNTESLSRALKNKRVY